MSKTFTQLLRSSKFANFTPNTKQIIHAPSLQSLKIGNWGLKHNYTSSHLSNESVPVIQLSQIDTSYGIPSYTALSEHELNRLKSIRDIFGSSLLCLKEESFIDSNADPIAEMSQEEYEKLKEKVKESQVREKYLKRMSREPKLKFDPLGLSKVLELNGVERKRKFLQFTQSVKVEGRVLNALPNGYAIGIAGLVCFLPKTAPHFIMCPNFTQNARDRTFPFYLDRIDVIPAGQSEEESQFLITVSLKDLHGLAKDDMTKEVKQKSERVVDLDLGDLLKELMSSENSGKGSKSGDLGLMNDILSSTNKN